MKSPTVVLLGLDEIVWDLLFGTYHRPANAEVGMIGVLNSAFPTSYWGQLKAAFARKVIDKPSDFYQRESEYLEQIAAENAADWSKIATEESR